MNSKISLFKIPSVTYKRYGILYKYILTHSIESRYVNEYDENYNNRYTNIDFNAINYLVLETNMYDINFIKSLTNLMIFDKNNCNFRHVRHLYSLYNLKELYIYKCDITTIRGIEYLNNLEILDISRNNIKSLVYISNLHKLKTLDIYKNPINSICQYLYIPLSVGCILSPPKIVYSIVKIIS